MQQILDPHSSLQPLRYQARSNLTASTVMLSSILSSLLALLLLSLIAMLLVWSSYRQYRYIQKLKAREKLLQERERQEEIIQLETRHRSSLAAAAAHKINNPMNHLNLQITGLSMSLQSLDGILQAIFQASEPEDEDSREISTKILKLLNELKDTNQGMSKSLRDTSLVVAELRAASGIDGALIENFSLGELLLRTQERLQEILDPKEFARLEFDTSQAKLESRVNSDRFIMKHGLEQLLLLVLSKTQGSFPIRLQTTEEGFLLSIPFLSGIVPASLEALEASLSNVLGRAAIKPVLTLHPDKFQFAFVSIGEAPITKEQAA